MAERGKRSKIKKFTDKYIDEVGAVASGFGALHLRTYVPDFYRETKSSYLKNITKLKKAGKLTDAQVKRFRRQIHGGFSKPVKGRSFRFLREAKKFGALFRPGSFKGSPKDLRKLNRKALLKAGLRTTRRALPALGLTFLAAPAAQAYQAKYAPKRKFKKELKKNVRKGIINPVAGGALGIATQNILDDHPYLRRAKSVRRWEGRISQKYGQGVGFYKGSSGMTHDEQERLNQSLRRYYKKRRKK